MSTPRSWHDEAQRILAREAEHPNHGRDVREFAREEIARFWVDGDTPETVPPFSYDDLIRDDDEPHEDPMYADDLYRRVWGHGPDEADHSRADMHAWGPGEDYEGRGR